MEEDLGFSLAAVTGTSIGVAGIAVFAGWYLINKSKKRLGKGDQIAVVWLLYNAIVHFVIEGSFIFYSLTGTIDSGQGPMADLWKEYAKADSRWGVFDPTIVSVELLIVFFNGPLILILLHSILVNKPYRHFVQVLFNTSELYSGWMIFAPEWVTGSPHLNTSSMFYLWVYLVSFNALWVVAPILLLVQSYFAITSTRKKKT